MNIYEFRQNNSGGSFDVNDNVTHRVFIEAKDKDAAIYKALTLGVYFDGVDEGIDCECCGNRWHKPWHVHTSNSEDKPREEIEDELQELANTYGWTTPDIYLYYADGTKKEFYTQKRT